MSGRLMGDPYSQDRAPKVTVEIGPLAGNAAGPAGPNGTYKPAARQEFNNVEEYCYDTDVLTLGDPFSVTLSNVDGAISGQVNVGDTVKFFISDPNVAGGAKVQKLQGIITSTDMIDDPQQGCKITITGADLGWHLANNCGPLFHRYRGRSLNQILADVIDPSWNLQGVRQGNDFNRKAKLGRQGVIPKTTAYQVVPPIQWEPGMMIADVLIPLARRQKFLLNVSADGFLQFFKPVDAAQGFDVPNQNQYVLYTFHHHKVTEKSRSKNNVKSVRLRQSLDGVYTQVTCVGQVAYPPYANTASDPNAGRKRGDFTNAAAAPFKRYVSFSDADQFDTAAATSRAQWKWQRGQFDSWVYEVTVSGHSQVGPNGEFNFYEPDTLCQIDDTVFGVSGTFYVSACRYSRTIGKGTETTLTIRKAGVLGA